MIHPKLELMKNYSYADLKKTGTIKLSLGEIVALKGFALRGNQWDMADKLRKLEKQILSKKKKSKP